LPRLGPWFPAWSAANPSSPGFRSFRADDLEAAARSVGASAQAPKSAAGRGHPVADVLRW
jgi:hypothetical protein